MNELLQRPFYLFQHRLALARIGMIAVAGANALFAVARLLQELWSGVPTAWRYNLAALLIALGLYRWYRSDPEVRVTTAIHGTAVIAWSLANLGAATGDERFRSAARAAPTSSREPTRPTSSR